MLKRALLAVVMLVLLLAAALAINTFRQGSRQQAVQPLAPLALDPQAAAESLAAAVRARTVSGLLDPAGTAQAFEQLHAHLRQRYPLVHSKLEREVVGAATLVYTWKGSDAAAKPIGWISHQDVVPIAPGTEKMWKQPPFEGRIEGGFVWGRGAWDNKANMVAQLEAVEMLLAAGFQPRRTLVLILGHDEEVGGFEGAARAAALFKQRGVRFDYTIDEGMLVTEGILPGMAAPIALIGVAEKGFLSLRLAVNATPGHSSLPPGPGQSAIGILSPALAKVDANPIPGGLQGVAGQMFGMLAPEFGGLQRVVLSNLWLFRPLVERQLEKAPSTNALLRTTTALTIFNAGNKENVLPGRAEAVVNFRTLPGDTKERVIEHVRRVVNDERVEISALVFGDASPVSSSESEAYRRIERTAREVFAPALVAPALMLAGTDTKHFTDIADHSYRFSPIRARSEDLSRFHGTDERVSIANLAEMIRFYHRLLVQSAS